MNELNLEARLEAMMGEMAALRQQVTTQQVRLNELEGRSTATPTSPTLTTTSRRRMLRRLAGGMIGGLALTGVALASGDQMAQARTVVNPAGTNNQIGSIVVPPGKPLPTGTPPTTYGTYYYGLIATDGSNVNLSNDSPLANVALFGVAIGIRSYGVYSEATGTYSHGVVGVATGSGSYGIFGSATGSGSYGVYSYATGSNNYGVYSYATDAGSYAGYFEGNVQVTGTLSKGGGSFKIDHPQDPANSYLYHSFVESPDMMNIYNGLVTLDGQGTATIELAVWFETLNSDFRYGLTAIGQPSPDLYIAEEVKGGKFKIAGGKAGQRVSWQLTGIRQDEWAKAHRIPVEEVKPAHEKGLYLHPELYGQPEEKGINRARQPKQ